MTAIFEHRLPPAPRSPADIPEAHWQLPIAQLAAALQSGPEGLTEKEAGSRLRLHGPNALHPPRRRALMLQFALRFRNPLVLALLAASTLSALVGDFADFVLIWIIVLLSVALDFALEHRAERAAERLRAQVALRATVLRDGQPQERHVAEVVPGDVVLLSTGDLVPADGRVAAALDCFVNQAALTGESYPVEKHAADARPDAGAADLAAADNALFMGSSVLTGTAQLLVVRTGADTVLGQIGGALAAPPHPAPSSGARGSSAWWCCASRCS